VYQGKLYSSTIMGDLASVVANVIEHSSWEKSRRGRICCFPPKGGLHHTFGDASLEMRLDIPHWCYSYKLQSPSSRRTCAAAVEYRIMLQIHRGHSTNHRRCTVWIAKGSSSSIIYARLSPVKLPPWIYNAYRQTSSRTILLSAMEVMITSVYCPHPWKRHGIVFEYAMVTYGWPILWILTLDFGTLIQTVVLQYSSVFQG
jgi:hypothetical protein